MRFGRSLVLLAIMMMTFGLSAAFAQESAADAASTVSGFGNLGAAFAIGVAAFGGSLGQGKVAASALEGIARNPAAQGKIFVPMIIALALIESLVLYAFIIALVRIKI